MKGYDITPCPKPRMTQSDKWKKRPPVLRYFAFKDRVKELDIKVPPAGADIIFIMPVMKSWWPAKKLRMLGEPHQQKPDLDNLLKALFDAIYDDDAHIWHVSSVQKIWGETGSIFIGVNDEPRPENRSIRTTDIKT